MPSMRASPSLLSALLATALLVAVVVVQVLISVGVPVWKDVYFARLAASSDSVKLGVWSLCTSRGACTPAAVGLAWDTNVLDAIPAPAGGTLLKGLTAALILHPIAAGVVALAALALLVAGIRLRPTRSTGLLWLTVLGTLLACLVTLAALAVTLAVVLLARSRYTGTVSFGPALWMSVGASAGAVVATLLAILSAGLATTQNQDDMEYSVSDSSTDSLVRSGKNAREDQELHFLSPHHQHPEEVDTSSRTHLNPYPVAAAPTGAGYAPYYDAAYNTPSSQAYPAWNPGSDSYPSGHNTPNWQTAYEPYKHPAHPAQGVAPTTLYTQSDPHGQVYMHDSAFGQPAPTPYTTSSPPEGYNSSPAHVPAPHTTPQGEEEYGLAYTYPTGGQARGDDHPRLPDAYDPNAAAYDPSAAYGHTNAPATTSSSHADQGADPYLVAPPNAEAQQTENNRARTREAYARVANTLQASSAQHEEQATSARDITSSSGLDGSAALPDYSSAPQSGERHLSHPTGNRLLKG